MIGSDYDSFLNRTNKPTIRVPAKTIPENIKPVPGPAYLVTADRIELIAPPPEAIAAFMDQVRRLNNSVEWGTVEPGASVWAWLERLAS